MNFEEQIKLICKYASSSYNVAKLIVKFCEIPGFKDFMQQKTKI